MKKFAMRNIPELVGLAFVVGGMVWSVGAADGFPAVQRRMTDNPRAIPIRISASVPVPTNVIACAWSLEGRDWYLVGARGSDGATGVMTLADGYAGAELIEGGGAHLTRDGGKIEYAFAPDGYACLALTPCKPYRLEDPLTFADGSKVMTKADWRRRRAEILEMFQREMYGRMPPKPATMVTDLLDERETCSTFAIRRRMRMWFRADRTGPFVDWMVIRPKNARKDCPPIIFLNSLGDFQLLPDEDLAAADGFVTEYAPSSGSRANLPNQKGQRGIWCNPNNRYHWPLGSILANGFAVVTACYYDIAPDPSQKDRRATEWRRRCLELWPETEGREDDTRSLMAWAWGLCRGLDLAEKEPGIDASRAIVTGCSRLGKAALIAGAFDERFMVVVPNQTGKGGVPLSKRVYGERIALEAREFPHWFTPRYLSYADRDAELPYDQHLLLACIAPRALLVEGFDSPWFDTKGEFLALKAASPVWTFLGAEGLPDVDWPKDFEMTAVGHRLGYVRRNGQHGLWAYDWEWLMGFAKRAFKTVADR